MTDTDLIRRGLHAAARDHEHSDDVPAEDLWTTGRRRRTRVRAGTLSGATLGVAAAAALPFVLPSALPDSSTPTDPVRPRQVLPAQGELDRDAIVAQCLRDRGWPVTYEGDGSLLADPVSDEERFDLATTACEDVVNLDSQEARTSSGEFVTPDQATAFHEDLLGLADCLTDHGFATTAPPSADDFTHQLLYLHTLAWHPYDGAYLEGQLHDAALACPPVPTPWMTSDG